MTIINLKKVRAGLTWNAKTISDGGRGIMNGNFSSGLPSSIGLIRDLDHRPQEWITLDELSKGSRTMALMVGRSAMLKDVFAAVERLCPHKTTVLIQGESGTGKELVSRALHSSGRSPRGPFVTFNCSNLVEALADSQLFGHARGAFTDARDDSPGYFRLADSGTLLLDELAELPLGLQPKLLRAVETGEIQPVGGSRFYHVDVRLVAATNRDLKAMVKTGKFRADLFYRLAATSIVIPPLRSRSEDVAPLTAFFIERHNRVLGKSVKLVSREAFDILNRYEWPGNVRELANVLESAMICSSNERIDVSDLPSELRSGGETGASDSAGASIANTDAPNLLNSIDDTVRAALLRSLKETRGNRRRAADLLGISRSTLYRLLTRYEIM